MHPKKQFDVLRLLVKLDIDIDQLDTDQKADYEHRRELKKEVTALETRRDAIKLVEGLPKTKKDEAALVQELRSVQEYNSNLDRQQRDREERKGHLQILKRDIESHKAILEEMQERIYRMEAEVTTWTKAKEEAEDEIVRWEPLPPLKDAGEIADTITAARKINAAIDQRDQQDKLQKEIDRKETVIEGLSKALKERDEQKVKAMEEAKFPVKGLGFGNEEVTFDGLPWNQMSNADQIRASVAIGIAYNPKLRVMRIKDGSLLDEKSMAILAEMSVTEDMQMFVECVDTTGKIGVYLEDGEIKAVNDEPEPQFSAPAKAKKTAAKKRAAKIPATT
jgi:hypothetical protein